MESYYERHKEFAKANHNSRRITHIMTFSVPNLVNAYCTPYCIS